MLEKAWAVLAMAVWILAEIIRIDFPMIKICDKIEKRFLHSYFVGAA